MQATALTVAVLACVAIALIVAGIRARRRDDD
jgi:hypothetical protein